MLDGLWLRLAAGLVLSGAVAAAGRARSALSGCGAAAAVAGGTLALAGGGWAGATALLFFFLSGSVLTALRRRHQGRPMMGRTARQVLANGLPAAVAGLAQLTSGPHPAWQALMLGSLAAMTADTWATEVGLLSRAPARLILNGRPVPAGTSGGVSLPGSLAGVAGAWLVSLLAGWIARLPAPWPWLASPTVGQAAVVGGGLEGLVLDSLLGASIQARYRCLACDRPVESPERHRWACPSARLVRVGGVAWVDNDIVNTASAWAAGAVAAAWTACSR